MARIIVLSPMPDFAMLSTSAFVRVRWLSWAPSVTGIIIDNARKKVAKANNGNTQWAARSRTLFITLLSILNSTTEPRAAVNYRSHSWLVVQTKGKCLHTHWIRIDARGEEAGDAQLTSQAGARRGNFRYFRCRRAYLLPRGQIFQISRV